MLGAASSHARAPHPKRRWLQLPSHQSNHRRFIQAELRLYRFKCSSVLPGHLNNSGDASCGQRSDAGLCAARYRLLHTPCPHAIVLRSHSHCSFASIDKLLSTFGKAVSLWLVFNGNEVLDVPGAAGELKTYTFEIIFCSLGR